MPKQPEEMTLEELSLDLRKRADSLDHLTARGEMDRRQLIATLEATAAQKAAADAARTNATYMLSSVIRAKAAHEGLASFRSETRPPFRVPSPDNGRR